MDPTIAVLDACVLYPAPLRDALLEIAIQGLFRPRWTDAIHEEWISHVLQDRPDLNSRMLARTRRLMETAFPDAQVRGYQKHISQVTLPDAKDRHVLAAAITSNAATIVTFNLKDFPSSALRPLNIEARHPDDFLCGQFAASPDSVCHAIRRLRGRLKRPAMNVETYLEVLLQQRLPRFVEMLQRRQQDI
jgi:PIN domain